MEGGLVGFSRAGGGGEYAVLMLQVSSSALEQLWQAVLPSLLRLVVPHVQAALVRAAAAASAQGAGKETLKAVLLALWHWLHLVIAPGALAPLPPIALPEDMSAAAALGAGGQTPRFPAASSTCLLARSFDVMKPSRASA